MRRGGKASGNTDGFVVVRRNASVAYDCDVGCRRYFRH